MGFNVISDKENWDKQLSLISPSNKDIYFTYEYCYLHQANGDGEVKVATYIGANGSNILYPFIMKPIYGYETETKYFNIESAYGYGGPIVENYNYEDMKNFEEQYNTWCKQNNIVAEFIRFHPLLQNEKYFNFEILKEKNRETVYLDLEPGIDSIWQNSITSKNRNMIRKAIKENVVASISKNYEEFIKIYQTTMKRLEANPYFLFSDKYYKYLFEIESLILLEAKKEEEVIACAIFLFSDDYLNYHLAGSNENYLNLAPNNLLLFKAAEYGCSKGFKRFHLGGGTTNSEEDSLFKFKKSFSHNKSEFFTGKRIHNKIKYDYFMNEWKKKTGLEPRIFLQYET